MFPLWMLLLLSHLGLTALYGESFEPGPMTEHECGALMGAKSKLPPSKILRARTLDDLRSRLHLHNFLDPRTLSHYELLLSHPKVGRPLLVELIEGAAAETVAIEAHALIPRLWAEANVQKAEQEDPFFEPVVPRGQRVSRKVVWGGMAGLVLVGGVAAVSRSAAYAAVAGVSSFGIVWYRLVRAPMLDRGIARVEESISLDPESLDPESLVHERKVEENLRKFPAGSGRVMEKILKGWSEGRAFEASLEGRRGKTKYLVTFGRKLEDGETFILVGTGYIGH
jgi:hypothetical protein